jgi:tol-pal system protein YbgF
MRAPRGRLRTVRYAQRSRVLRSALAALPIAALLVLGGCATKSDVRVLRTDLQRMQLRQDSVLREIQRQNTQLLDSIRATISLTVSASGTTAAQLRQFQQNVDQLGQLTGQVMGTLNRIEQRLSLLEQRPGGMPGGVPGGGVSGGGVSGGGTAEQYYTTGMQKLSEGSFTAARLAFEQLIAEFPQHERAPEAQFQLGQAYFMSEQYDDAYGAFDAVAERWPDAPRAPAALFRAGAIAKERRDFPRARTYFERVRQRYPSSDEARQAQRELSSLPRR